jgi:hypothetical protein
LDFRDSPEEADFRNKLRTWLAENAAAFKASGDDYWTRQGEWHQALYQAGFFGTSWPREFGGQELPPVYDVIVDEELARAGAPPRPSLGYLVVGLGHHGSKELQQRFLPGMINGTSGGARGSASRAPARTWRRSPRPRPVTAKTTSSTATRSGPATPTSPTGACCSPAPTRTCRGTRASRRSSSRCISRASSSGR